MSKKNKKENNKSAPVGDLKQIVATPKAVPPPNEYKNFARLISNKFSKQTLIDRWLDRFPGFDANYPVDEKPLVAHAHGNFDALWKMISVLAEHSPEVNIEITPGVKCGLAEYAAITNKIGILKKLRLSRPQVLLQQSSDHRETLLHFAVLQPTEESVEVIQLLAEAKVDLDAVDCKGKTAAFVAAERDNLVGLRELHRLGANLAIRDLNGTTLYAIARANKSENVLPFLKSILKDILKDAAVKSPTPVDYFYQGINNGDLAVVQRWHGETKGLDLNQRHEFVKPSPKITALGQATIRGYAEIIRYLLEQKADVDASDERGITPLMNAVGNGNQPVMRQLLNARANPNAVDARDRSVLQAALVDKASVETVEILLKAKADVNFAWPEKGFTALHFAVMKRLPPIISLLLKHPEAEVDPELRDNNGDTALLLAVRHGYEDETKALLECSEINREVRDWRECPLTFAALLELEGQASVRMLSLLFSFDVSALLDVKGLSLAAYVILLGLEEIWPLINKHAVKLAEVELVIEHTMKEKYSLDFVKDVVEIYLVDLDSKNKLWLAGRAVEYRYIDVIPILLPGIKLPPRSLRSQESLQASIETFEAEQGAQKKGAELTAKSGENDQKRSDISAYSDSKLTQGISGLKFLLEEAGRSAKEISALRQPASPDKNTKQKLLASLASSLWASEAKPCAWFEGRLQSTAPELKHIMRGKIRNNFLYIDPTLSPEAYDDPSIQALLKKDRWAFDPKNGLKGLEGKMKTNYSLMGDSDAKPQPVDIAYEIVTRRTVSSHDRVLVFCVNADEGSRGVLYVATAALVAEGGLGKEGKPFTPPQHVKVTLPVKATLPEVPVSSAPKIKGC